jgi:hypothetical protein
LEETLLSLHLHHRVLALLPLIILIISSHKDSFKKPLLKIDVKFSLPMFNGDVNLEKIDNWIRQVEVYFYVQQIDEEEVKVQLASLQLEGTALEWWERKL